MFNLTSMSTRNFSLLHKRGFDKKLGGVRQELEMTNMRKRVARSLNFRSGKEIQAEHETSPLPNIMSMVALPA